MKAMQFQEYGKPEVLHLEEVLIPDPTNGQVRMRVAATTFNNVDGNIRAGNMQGPMPLALPHTPGLDVSGTVDAVGSEVDDFSIGDEVIGFLPFTDNGASAEFVIAPVGSLTIAPKSIPLADAAALPLVGLTAWQALFEHAELKSGQRILINGAGGAVGGYAVQLAKSAGAYVIATASPRSGEQVKAAGADETIDHTSSDLTEVVTQQVDVLLNLAPIDHEMFESLVGLVRDGGVVVSTTVWMSAPSDKERGVRGIDVYVRSDAKQLSELAARVDRGELKVAVGERVALTDLPLVHARAAAGTLTGKVIVLPTT